MRITIIMGFFLPMPPAAGGATEKTWDRLAREFNQRGHQVTIISRTWQDWPHDEVRDGVRYRRFAGADHTASLPRNLWLDFRWSMRLRAQLPPADVTIINCVTLPALLGTAPHLGRRVVMIGRRPKGQFRLYRHIDRVLAVSSPVLEAVRHENPSVATKAVVTGYPIDWRRLATRETAANRLVTIGYVGRIHREKGLHLLVGALKQLAAEDGLPEWRAFIGGPSDVRHGGSGPDYLAGLRRELSTAGRHVPCEFLEPRFNDEPLAALYQEADIFCYPSIAERGETFGVAVAEAMAAGAVPVVSGLPCFADYIEPGRNGLVFDHRGADAIDQLTHALKRLLQDSARRTELAAAAQAAVARYDYAPYAERLLNDFSALK